MYLKRKETDRKVHFILAESFHDGVCWRSRDVMDLGRDPGACIVYGGGNSFFFRDDVERTLKKEGAVYSHAELERLFLPFLEPCIRRIVQQFDRGPGPGGQWKRLAPAELMKRHRALHAFDKRRLHYLRCGRVDIGNLNEKPWKFLNILLDKSRDEIEHMMEAMERELPPYEIRPYLYTALEVQTHFRHLHMRHEPAVLDPDKVDGYFLEDLCHLNRDDRFFTGVDREDAGVLHPYLRRYLFLYYDHAFEQGSAWADYVEDFIYKHRFYRSSPSPATLSPKQREACRWLNIPLDDFGKMDRTGLARCYRREAKKVHPDRGGHEKAFVRLTEAYECLLRMKP